MAMNPVRTIEDAEKTYMALRWLLAVIALAFPVALVGGGCWLKDITVLPQLSAYYFTPMGDLFVGMLCAVGVGLIAYKGFTDAEDMALNTGGVLVCLVAVFHMHTADAINCLRIGPATPDAQYLLRSIEIGAPGWLHFTCAVLFYVALGYVMVFCSHASLSALHAPQWVKQRYRRAYTVLGVSFVLSVIVSFAIYEITQRGCGNRWILVAEVLGLMCFGAFWILKTIEIRKSGADKLRSQFDRKARQPAFRELW
jgi:hypothetical protein